MTEYPLFLWISGIMILIGGILLKILEEIPRNKTTKKLGYGPELWLWGGIPLEGTLLHGLSWSKEYYDNTLIGKIKPEYKNKVDLWYKEYGNNQIRYRPLLISSFLLFIIGFLGIVYYLHLVTRL